MERSEPRAGSIGLILWINPFILLEKLFGLRGTGQPHGAATNDRQS
jgi:hypothetical protein